jgi:small subunit ribosomal protein S1
MSWDKNLKTPAQILNEGDKIEVMILKMDVENHKVSLGIKQVDGDPWEKIRDDFSEGDVVEGEIKNITDFGAFVEIVPGVEGLLHVSDISWERVDKPQDVLNVGDTIKVMILKINEDERKVALGIKQTLPNPWDEMMSDYKVGDVVTVTVSKITKNNAICKMENGIEGFLAISQLDTKHVEKVDDVVNVGDEIEVKIIKIQKNERKIDFSIKALKQDTEKQILDEIKGEAGNHDKVSLKDVIEQEMVDNIAGETEKKTKAAPKKKAAKKKSEDETPAETPEEAEEDGGEEKKED